MESEEILEAYTSHENFQQLLHKAVEELKSVDELYDPPEHEDSEEQEDLEKENDQLYEGYASENESIIDC